MSVNYFQPSCVTIDLQFLTTCSYEIALCGFTVHSLCRQLSSEVPNCNPSNRINDSKHYIETVGHVMSFNYCLEVYHNFWQYLPYCSENYLNYQNSILQKLALWQSAVLLISKRHKKGHCTHRNKYKQMNKMKKIDWLKFNVVGYKESFRLIVLQVMQL